MGCYFDLDKIIGLFVEPELPDPSSLGQLGASHAARFLRGQFSRSIGAPFEIAIIPTYCSTRVQTEKEQIVLTLELSYKSWRSGLEKGNVSLCHRVTLPFFKTLAQDFYDAFLNIFHERI